ncbi:heat shock factor binding protein 1-domain-containing protein [Microdochium bolleyi]|uniref:Heat shock factor binding protein 1-domain-containing protein n=1 Tax=Microdochium bolleyi TaxID=196109 RepID=A0A136J6Z0_9PEZI|nr:heat shock factor binding protein 1-domain-containing protein [Microdochium bolleyi]
MPSPKLEPAEDIKPVPAQPEGTSTDELTAVVEDLLNSLSNKFAGVSSEIFAKMDEMSRRLDNLEAALKTSQDANSNSPSKPQ